MTTHEGQRCWNIPLPRDYLGVCQVLVCAYGWVDGWLGRLPQHVNLLYLYIANGICVSNNAVYVCNVYLLCIISFMYARINVGLYFCFVFHFFQLLELL